MADYDYVVVGSGINALVAAALLGKKRRKVLLLERSAQLGGCIRTEEMIAPGFIHDVMATTFVLFLLSPAYAALGKDLEARGLAFAHTDQPTGVLLPDGRHLIFTTDRARNIAAFEHCAAGDGDSFGRQMQAVGQDAPFLFALLGGRLWSPGTLRLLAQQAWRRGPRGLAGWFGEALVSARAHLETTYSADLIRALWAPWVLHCGLGPESAYSAQMAKVIAFAVEAAGCPIVAGGAGKLVGAFAQLIADTGGTIRTDADADTIVTGATNRAGGVRLTSGETINAGRGVICCVTPSQLYGRLLKDWPSRPPAEVKDGLRHYRHGKGNMQIHYALSEPPRWRADAALGRVALLHLTPGLDGVSRAANEAERGMLPSEPTICVSQPTALDPSRAPAGGAVLWLQLAETPRAIKGDSAGQIEIPPDGCWTETVRERYADRVEAQLARHIEGFASTVIGRRVYSPGDLEAMNMNLVGGDPYGGACGLDQFFVWRPFKSSVNHRTYVANLFHIGASTHPGPGLAGGSGYLLATSLA